MRNETSGTNARVFAFDLVACIALAAAVALATAVVLVATVLLLAGRAEASQPEPGSLLLKILDGKDGPRAPLLHTDVSFRVSGMVARARVMQTFHNVTHVANIGPREFIAVELEYQQTLRYDNGRYSLRFPMVVAPRYIPGINPVTLRVELDAGVPIAQLSSDAHRVEVKDLSESRRSIELTAGVVTANRDFELTWAPRGGQAPQRRRKA